MEFVSGMNTFKIKTIGGINSGLRKADIPQKTGLGI
jgi:hypothetical protein